MAIPPVTVEFQVAGVRNVQAAFRSIEQTTVRAERAAVRATQSEGKAREKTARDAVRAADRSAKDQTKAAEKAAKDQTKAVEQSTKEKMRLFHVEDRARSEALRTATREVERAERERESISSRWVRKREREEIASARRVQRARESLGRTLGGAATRGFNSGMGTMARGATAIVGGLAELGGGYSIAGSVQQRLGAERSAALLANSAHIVSGKNANVRPDEKAILAHAKAVGIATNTDTGELIEGVRDYVAKSADFKGGMANMEFFAKVAKGTGTSFADVTKTAGILRTQNDKLDDTAMRKLILTTIGQGKEGAVEFSDLAKVAGKVTKTAAAYGMDQTQAQGSLLGLAQFAIKTSGSADEAATVVSNFGSDTLKKRAKLAAAGINATDKDGNLKDPSTIIQDVFTKTGGNLGKIQDLGYGARSMKLFEALAPAFREAGVALGPKATAAERAKAGAAEVGKQIGDMSAAQHTEADMNSEFADVMKTSSERLESAFHNLSETTADALAPELENLIPKVAELTPKLVELLKGAAKLADWFLKDPLSGTAALVGLAMTKELAAVGMKSLFEKAFQSMAGAGLTVGAGVAVAFYEATVSMIDTKKDDLNNAVLGGSAAEKASRELKAKILNKTGHGEKLTQEDIEKAQRVLDETGKATAEERRHITAGGRTNLEDFNRGLAKLADPEAVASDEKNQAEVVKANLDAMKDLTAAINGARGAIAGPRPGVTVREHPDTAGTAGHPASSVGMGHALRGGDHS